jgi:hypothetical protein
MMEFSGKVRFANGLPAKGVRVRVFDKDEPGKEDDDLTVSEGVSDDAGEFVVSYKPSRFLDYTVVETTAPRNPLVFDFVPVTHVRHAPDLTDRYQPYLTFDYVHREQARRHAVSMMPFVREFRLPEALVPDESFSPSQHGFKFVNSFEGYPLPFSVPELPELPFIPQGYGLCGGMACAASDLWLYGRSVPSRTKPPGKRAALHKYLYRRQMDTFGAGRYVVKFYRWMAMQDGTVGGTQVRTYDEFGQVRKQLDDGMPVVLGLVYVRLRETVAMWENHQVLAYAYEDLSPEAVRIKIYDPNYPGQDRITIEAARVTAGSRWTPTVPPRRTTAYGYECVQRTPGRRDTPVRGFFVMPYVPVSPPPVR